MATCERVEHLPGPLTSNTHTPPLVEQERKTTLKTPIWKRKAWETYQAHTNSQEQSGRNRRDSELCEFPEIARWTYLGLLSSKNSFSSCMRWPLVLPAGTSFLSIILHDRILDSYWYTFLLMPVWSLRGIFVGQAYLSLVIKCPQKLNRFLFCLLTTRFVLK